jgi:transcriptional regulator of heat shock response
MEDKKDFSWVIADFVKEYAVLFPDETPLNTNNPQLSNLHIPADTVLEKVRLFHQKFSSDIKGYNQGDIPAEKQADFNKMQNILKNIDAYLANASANPTYFNVLHGFQRILNTNYAPMGQRLQTLFDKLAQVPDFYEAAKKQLKAADVKKADETLEKHFQTYAFFNETLPETLEKEGLMTPQYEARLDAAKLAVKDYVAFVASLRLQ